MRSRGATLLAPFLKKTSREDTLLSFSPKRTTTSFRPFIALTAEARDRGARRRKVEYAESGLRKEGAPVNNIGQTYKRKETHARNATDPL